MKTGDLVKVVLRNHVHGGKLALVINVGADPDDPPYDKLERRWVDVILAGEGCIRNVSSYWLESIESP